MSDENPIVYTITETVVSGDRFFKLFTKDTRAEGWKSLSVYNGSVGSGSAIFHSMQDIATHFNNLGIAVLFEVD